MNFFICSIAKSTGITSVIRKNADCKIVLVRLPKPISCAIFVALIVYRVMFFCANVRFTFAGIFATNSSSFQIVFNRNVPFWRIPRNTSYIFKYACTWHATKLGVFTKYVERIGLSPKRRWEQVNPPDFLESYEKYAWQYLSVFSPMIFTEFLFAPTVPSAPNPKNFPSNASASPIAISSPTGSDV